jgi:hypothetical protein
MASISELAVCKRADFLLLGAHPAIDFANTLVKRKSQLVNHSEPLGFLATPLEASLLLGRWRKVDDCAATNTTPAFGLQPGKQHSR